MDEPKLNQAIIQSHIEKTFLSQLETPISSALYLVATPIGNLADISLRALSTLAKVDIIYCEDTRHSRKLLNHYGIKTHLKAYHEHNAHKERDHILNDLAQSKALALISDAGTPLISDPGFKLVREVISKGFTVESLPGPSAPVMALTLAGLPTDRFLFEGFLAPKQAQRIKQLEKVKDIQASLIFFETANRLSATINDMKDVFGERPAVIARELSKKHETVLRGTLTELSHQIEEVLIKGEIVIIAGPPLSKEIDDNDIIIALERELQDNTLRDAVKNVTTSLDLPKKRVYNLALTIKSDKD